MFSPIFPEQAKRRGAFLPFKYINLLHIWVFSLVHMMVLQLFRTKLIIDIISTLLFQIIIFKRYSRSKIKNDSNFFVQFRQLLTEIVQFDCITLNMLK